MCVLGMHEELRPDGIAVNGLWPRTAIWTAAVAHMAGGRSRKVFNCHPKVEIVPRTANANFWIVLVQVSISAELTGFL